MDQARAQEDSRGQRLANREADLLALPALEEWVDPSYGRNGKD